MKILVIQKSINDLDIKSYLDEVESKAVDLVCFGELALSGCLYDSGDGIEIEDVKELVADYPMAIMLGLPCSRGGKLFNSYVYFSNNEGQIYDKINLFEPMGETNVYQPGIEPLLVDSPLGKIGALICYDLRFEEPFANLKARGAKYVFVPAAWPRVRIEDWKRLLVQRAIDNEYYIIGINAVGDDGRNEFGGCSMVVDPTGKIIARADEEAPTILEVEI